MRFSKRETLDVYIPIWISTKENWIVQEWKQRNWRYAKGDNGETTQKDRDLGINRPIVKLILVGEKWGVVIIL